MKRFENRLLIFILSLFLTITACDSARNEKGEVETERVAPVKVVKLERGDIASYINATGTICPNQGARIAPKVEGRIEKIFVDEGDRVKKGQPLIKVEQHTYVLRKTEAEASLQTAQSRLEKAGLNLKNIARNYERLSKLWEGRLIAEQKYDKILTEYNTAQVDLELAKAELLEAKAKLALTEHNLKETITYAPFSGFVVEKLMEEGEISDSLTQYWDVLHLVDISKVKIVCLISETKLPYLYVGKKESVEVDAYPGKLFTGKIIVINPKVDPVSRNFRIKIELNNPDFKLRGGMFVRVKIAQQEKKEVLKIPKRALLTKEGKYTVFVIENGQARSQTVRLGISDGQWIEVIEGLKEGDEVVVEGLYALRDGIKTEVIP